MEAPLPHQCLLSRKGPLGAIWIAAYCCKKLKKSQVMETDISSSVDKILQDELNVVTYRILAYLLLGIARIYSKKVEYLYVDCNVALTEINEFVISTKDRMRKDPLQAPYYAITLPNRFELDAFDLGIVEDVTGSNMVPYEEITLKDNMWKNGITQSFDENHGEEITEADDILCTDNSLIEDVFSPHLKDLEKRISTVISQIMPEKSQVSTFSHENDEVKVSTKNENESPNPVEPLDKDYESREDILKEEMGQHKNIIPEASNEMVLADGFCYEENTTMATASGREKGSTDHFWSSHEECQSDETYGGLVHSEDDHQITNEVHNFSNSQRSTEKLRDNSVALVDSMDIGMSCGAKNGSPKLAGMDSEGRDLSSLEMKSPEKRNHDDNRKDLQLSISLDGISHSEFLDFTGTKTPEFMVVPTPAKKERPRKSRKRKCIVDDFLVLTNEELKQSIYDASDLVVKRRKCPHSSLTASRATQISNLSSGFLVPLISCVSPELISLFCETRVNKSAQIMELPQNLDDPSSTAFGQKTDRQETNFEIGEHSNALDVSGSIITNRSEQIMNCIETGSEISVLERLCFSEPQHSDRNEQMAIAPGTPVQCSTSARSFESPESPKVRCSTSARSFESPKVPNLNAIMCCEEDDPKPDGWSERTRMVAGCLLENFTNRRVQSLEEVVNLSHLLSEKPRRVCATVFYETLVLKTKAFVDLRQDQAYGDILVWKLPNWDLAFRSHLSITCEDSV